MTTKLEEAIVPSRSNSVVNNGASCAVVDTSSGAVHQSASPEPDTLFSNRPNSSLVKNMLELAQSILTERQKVLLVSAAEELRWDSVTLTRLCERLSRELRMSYSTVKWNMRRLRFMKLVCGGTEGSKGTPANLTPLGRLITSMLTKKDFRTR